MSAEPVSIAIAVVQQGDSYLVGLRPPGKPLAGFWEFPGGRVESGESPSDAAVRECLEETGISVRVVGAYPTVLHEYDHGHVRLFFFSCLSSEHEPLPRAPFRWVPRSELDAFRFPDANRQLLQHLRSDVSPDGD